MQFFIRRLLIIMFFASTFFIAGCGNGTSEGSMADSTFVTTTEPAPAAPAFPADTSGAPPEINGPGSTPTEIADTTISHSQQDTDGDGVTDNDDKCPRVPGPSTNHGCPASAPAPENPQIAKPAKVAYIYPKKIVQNEHKIITVRASVNQLNSDAKKAVQVIAEYSDSSVTENTYTTDIIGLEIYEYLTVTIDDPVGDFKIDSIIGYPSKQKVNSAKAAVWQWSISPKSTIGKKGRLLINIVPQPSDLQRLPVKTIDIQIETESFWDTLRRYLVYLLDPKIMMGIILIPAVAYFGKRRFDKKTRS